MVGKAQVVVGAEVQDVARLHADMRGLVAEDRPFNLPQRLGADWVEFGGNVLEGAAHGPRLAPSGAGKKGRNLSPCPVLPRMPVFLNTWAFLLKEGQPMEKELWQGGCQCGAVRYEYTVRPDNAGICHCRMCQKQFGNFFGPSPGPTPIISASRAGRWPCSGVQTTRSEASAATAERRSPIGRCHGRAYRCPSDRSTGTAR